MKSAIINIGKKLQVSEGAAEMEYTYHTVTADDTSYWAIANRYGITVEKLMELNGLTEPKIYHVGEQIIVGKSSSTSSKATKQTKSSTAAQYHTIIDGDTLGHIAVKYNTTVKRLCELNNMTKTDILKLGKKLRVK